MAAYAARLWHSKALAGGLDNGDRGADRRLDVEGRGVEAVGVRGRLERRNRAGAVAYVATNDSGEDRGLICRVALTSQFERAPPRPHLRRSGYKDLGVRVRTDDGADVAAVEDGAGRARGEVALKLYERRAYFRDRRNHRSSLARRIALERGLVEARRVEGGG